MFIFMSCILYIECLSASNNYKMGECSLGLPSLNKDIIIIIIKQWKLYI